VQIRPAIVAPVVLVTIACASGAGRMTTTNGSTDPARPAPCRAALKALTEGRLAGWIGLDGCSEVDTEVALGAGRPGPALANAWGRARKHPGGPATPYGVDVWLDGPRVTAISVAAARIDPPLIAALGEPEARIESGLSSDWEQWAYPRRGLAAHVDARRNEVRVLYGFSPMAVSDFLKSEIAQVHSEEYPLTR